MMGTQNQQTPLFLYQVNLDSRVPPDYPLRKIKAAIDFSFVRAEVAVESEPGRGSIFTVVLNAGAKP
jgi:hypothetical protein